MNELSTDRGLQALENCDIFEMYHKLVQSGNYVEFYQYEKKPYSLGTNANRARGKRRSCKDADLLFIRRRDNVYRAKRDFVRLIWANLERTEGPALFTLTHSGIVGIEEGSKNLNKFIKRLRYEEGQEFRYVAVPEFQKRGSVHFHVLVWGLDSTKIKSERKERYFAGIWSYGFLDVTQTDGSDKLAGYLAKYMAKSFIDKRLCQKKAYMASRNVRRSSSVSNFPRDMLKMIVKKGSKVYQKDFQTQWLGSCRYQVYNNDV